MRRNIALALQVTGMALCPPALCFGLFTDKGMRLELTLLGVALILFYIGRGLEPQR